MMQSLSLALWSLVAVLLSLLPESLVLRVKRTVAPHSPIICRFLGALLLALGRAEVWSFGPLRSACAVARSVLGRFSCYLSRDLPALAVAPPAVEWWYTESSKCTKQPHARCRVVANGEACNCIAEVRRFSVNGVECARLPNDAFPVYLCPRHASLLPVLYPSLAAQVSPSSPSQFGSNHP